VSIGPIAGVAASGIAPISTSGLTTSAATGSTGSTGSTATGGASFGNVATDLVDSLQGQQDNADKLALAASTGNGNVGDVMIAATQASLSTNMTVAVRNKAVEAFNQIMGMQF
jgi:flagellar hook-basal body complex protein FliE